MMPAMKGCFGLVVAVVLAALAGAWAGEADDQYIEIYKLIREADTLNDSGQPSQALAKYSYAQTALQKFHKAYPDWNVIAVDYRLHYLAAKIAGVSAKLPAPAKAPPSEAQPATAPGPAAAQAAAAPAPSDWEHQLQALKEQARQLQADKALLEAKLKEALAVQPAAADPRELARAEEKIKALQKENDLFSVSLEQAKAKAAPAQSPEADRIKQLEWQRDDLTRKLEAANKALAVRKGKGSARAAETQNEINQLRARLEVLEAQKAPYTAEELAFFKPSEPRLAATNVVRKSVRELPAGMAALVSQARSYFYAKRYDKAEELYQQVLREDEKNFGALSDLAFIELKLNRLEAAEKHLQQALALAPDDPYSLLILGQLRLLQQKPDAALDALSRAAQGDPQNAEIQNCLGVVLAEKGQRVAAEAAFRKAILLQPGYGEAHKNLAFFYLTQQPPPVELARWHYQKALAAGLPHSPEIEKLIESKKTAAGGQGAAK